MNGLWPTTIWIWYLDRLPPGSRQWLAYMAGKRPGEVGVIVKAADGRYPWKQWNVENVRELRELGLGVGLWTFQYGRGIATYDGETERPGVAAEVDALRVSLRRAEPDVVVLNIEEQVLKSPDPYVDVRDLVQGSREAYGSPIGVSTVWHWADTMQWPFKAAVEGGLDYWSNQVYPGYTLSFDHYERYLLEHSGGKPDYISLSLHNPSQIKEHIKWARGRGSRGVAYWEAQSLNGPIRDAIDELADLFKGAAVEEPNPFWPQLGEGIAAAMRERGDEPRGPEHYMLDSQGRDAYSFAVGWQGTYRYYPDGGRVQFEENK